MDIIFGSHPRLQTKCMMLGACRNHSEQSELLSNPRYLSDSRPRLRTSRRENRRTACPHSLFRQRTEPQNASQKFDASCPHQQVRTRKSAVQIGPRTTGSGRPYPVGTLAASRGWAWMCATGPRVDRAISPRPLHIATFVQVALAKEAFCS